MTQALSKEDIADRVAALRESADDRVIERAEVQARSTDGYRYVRRFSDAYGSVIDVLESQDSRLMTGLSEIDFLTRGFGPKELILFAGFSHAGKTQLVNTMILNNRDRRILFFSMDDPREMILIKLACMLSGDSAEVLERKIRAHDAAAKTGLRAAATDHFRNLVVVDDSLGLAAMDVAIEEATDLWGAPPELIVVDYLGSMRSDGGGESDDGGIKQKASALKRWVKDKPFPTVCVHQNTRSNGGPGQPITITSIAFGGEQEATMIVGVRRKRDDADADDFVRRNHANTVTLHVVKNKRPPGKMTPPEGVDLYMEPDTGVIRKLRDTDTTGPKTGDVVRTAEQALKVSD